MGRLDGKVALITGGARGQGRAHAVRLAEEGADIVVIDACADMPAIAYPLPPRDELDRTAELINRLDRLAVARQADVRDPKAIEKVVDEAIAQFGHLDIVVANAGVAGMNRAWEHSEEQWQTILDINLTGVWHTTRAVAPKMIAAGRGGSIILTSSIAGTLGLSHMAAYVASKHGVLGLMKVLANELGPHGIRVNAVQPGTVNTQMTHNEPVLSAFFPDIENPTDDQVVERFTALNSLPVPWVEAVDISNAVLWLASDEARFVTGIAVPIDAGWLQKA
jgi:SDR family mycofactocin-dependent oxidoreductase